MMSKFGKELIESMRQAAQHARGSKVRGIRVMTVELSDIKTINKPLRVASLPSSTLPQTSKGQREKV